jgi:cephalosporin hydroxylase
MDKASRITVDLPTQTLQLGSEQGESRSLPLYSHEALRELSRVWIKVGWVMKYSYTFSWMGRPIIQLPDDLMRIQEVIFKVQPHVIIETGVAHGGSAVFYASLLELLGRGRVLSIDVEIRPHNREALDKHPLRKRITLIEGSSTSEDILREVRQSLAADDRVLVVLDSNHTKDHVRRELESYASMVTSGSYLIATDGIMEDLSDAPGGSLTWIADNPRVAIHEFLRSHSEFEIDPEPLRAGVTYWPDAYLRRK